MIKPVSSFQRTSYDETFNWNAKSFYQTFSILTFPLSSIVGVGSHYVATGHLSLHDHIGVLLQYAQIQLFSTSFCHLHLRYMHCSHSRSYTQGATYTEGRVYWLPPLWASKDYVQRCALVSLLWDTFILGWPSKHPLLALCKRFEVP